MSWYQTGFNALDSIPDLKRQSRFFLKPGEEKKIIFLDSQPFSFWEHQATINGDFRNYFTCLRNMNKSCPLCDAKVKKYFVGLFTIIEVGQWTDKEGKVHKNPIRLMPIKQTALKILKRHEEKGKIKNGLFTVYRSGPKSGTSGDVFDFEEFVNPLEYNPEAKVFDYLKECEPMSYEKLVTIAGLVERDQYDDGPTSSFSSAGTGGVPVEEDDCPF